MGLERAYEVHLMGAVLRIFLLCHFSIFAMAINFSTIYSVYIYIYNYMYLVYNICQYCA